MLLADLIKGIALAPLHLHQADTHVEDFPEIATETPSTATSATPPEPEPGPVSYGSLPVIADTDDRRTCSQCLNLRSGVCSVARPGGIVSANRGYRPNAETKLRCAGYMPNTTDNDQRPGAERWPGL